MSLRTLWRRLARSRAELRRLRWRDNSVRWVERISRCRERLFCFRAEEVRRDSLSRRRESWAIKASRWKEKTC